MVKRRNFDDDFKARVALETIKGEMTLSELSSKFGPAGAFEPKPTVLNS